MIYCSKNCPHARKVLSRKGRTMTVCFSKNKQEVSSGGMPKWCPYHYNKIADLIRAFSIPMYINNVFDFYYNNYSWRTKYNKPRWCK